ncbi:pentapeptide repeat-containing protein [Rhodococcus sp. IEGM 1379]|uniref:pentapeptide repeat-containing protein n=1 Tax=Rhodococcus sp. IEGM 1379 TaxID=3047086 RepID=UPI0024B858C0|nr:pentapeptide repeat-containing protein [Rhodococcus sp. IEGM 1379]MDI9917325.1 pentapeptide repeat-containing protein [Rhodococcus sp. IEGM 1379]
MHKSVTRVILVGAAVAFVAGFSSALPVAHAAPAAPIVTSSGVSVPGCALPYDTSAHAFCVGADLSTYDLSSPPFLGVDWSNAIFERATFEGREFPSSTEFFGTDFAGANLRSITAVQSNFNSSDMDYSDATGAILAGARMWRTSARNASFADADLTYVQFLNADLTNTDFTGANLTGATVVADVTGANFSDAIGVNLNGAIGVPLVGPPGYTPPQPIDPNSGPVSLSATSFLDGPQPMLKATWTNSSATASFNCSYDAHSLSEDGSGGFDPYGNVAPYIGPTITIPPSGVVDQVMAAPPGPLSVEWQCDGGIGETQGLLLRTTYHLGLVPPTQVTIVDPELTIPPPVVTNPGFGSSDFPLFGSSY